MSYYIVAPVLKSRSKNFNGSSPLIVDMLTEMTKLPHCSRSWKGLVSDVFYDNKFFTNSASSQWRYLVNALMSADKDKFVDLVSRVSSAPSTNIFANREYESLTRALNLRRLSFAIYAGDPGSYMSQLTIVKEKLVEVVRNNAITPISQSEVYLCLRVLLIRFKSDNLTMFWPIVITELLRLFEIIKSAPASEHSDLLSLLLSACKFLDTLLVLQNEDFQVYQSLFITDTVDASAMGDHQGGIIDQISQLFGNQEKFDGQFSPQLENTQRQPLLLNVKRIESVQNLQPFFSSVSHVTFNNVIDKQEVDWELLDRTIGSDFFDEE